MRDTLSKMGNAFYTRRMASYWRQGMDTTEHTPEHSIT